MAIREVREMGDDVLEKQCKPVTKMQSVLSRSLYQSRQEAEK